MNYSLAAGFFVTLSLFFLFLENKGKRTGTVERKFVVLYGWGVVAWVVLGVVINNIYLVTISAIQIFFLALFFSNGEIKP